MFRIERSLLQIIFGFVPNAESIVCVGAGPGPKWMEQITDIERNLYAYARSLVDGTDTIKEKCDNVSSTAYASVKEKLQTLMECAGNLDRYDIDTFLLRRQFDAATMDR